MTTASPTATLYRMVTPQHVCPSGLKARWLLRRNGYRIDDRPLESRAAQDAFKAAQGVRTTPQTFIGGQRIGGYEDVRRFLGLAIRDPDAPRYTPVIAVFAAAAAISLAVAIPTGVPAIGWVGAQRFVAVAMMLLAMLKLQDVERFATMFLGYDLLAQRFVPYAYAYPFAEFGAGALMLAGIAPWLSVPVAFVIGTIGAVSVVKAVYIDRRALKCACVGGGSAVPLGFVSLLENVMMAAMALAMGVAAWLI